MPLVAVTGLPGVGKSAVLERLRALGLDARGTDEDRLSGWRRKDTKAAVADPSHWHDPVANADIEYRVSRDRVEALRAEAAQRVVFVCGFAGDEGECWDLLDVVVSLVVDTETLKYRLASRTNNDYGKAEHELQQILEASTTWERAYREHGAVIVDAARSIDDVVADVVAAAETGLGGRVAR